jgi:hypothetical protein
VAAPDVNARTIARLLLLAAGVVSCRDVDVDTASYATLTEARQAGEIQQGWIPEGLPPGAFELRRAHNLDTNARWGLFNFPPSQASHLKSLLEASEFPLQGQRCNPPRRIEWWPILLRGHLDAERIAATGLKAYRTADSALLFAVNWNQGRAYYWSLSQ